MSIDPNRRQWNSSLRPKSLKRIAEEKSGVRKPATKKPTLEEVTKRFGIVRAALLGEPKKRKPIRKRAKNNPGWWDIALEIWAIRPHVCEVCRRELGDEPIPIYFSHLLPRGSYSKYKRDPGNIILKCAAHHKQWHEMGPEYLTDHWEWAGVCEKYYELRDEANNVNQ